MRGSHLKATKQLQVKPHCSNKPPTSQTIFDKMNGCQQKVKLLDAREMW